MCALYIIILDNIDNAKQLSLGGKLAVGTIETFLLFKLTEGKTGYRGLALFKLSSESLKKGDYEEALKFLKKASYDKSLTDNLRVFAKIKAGLILVDNGNYSDIELLLDEVVRAGGPFSFHAKEIMALSLIKEGRVIEAQGIFKDISEDASAPPVLARRAEIFLR